MNKKNDIEVMNDSEIRYSLNYFYSKYNENKKNIVSLDYALLNYDCTCEECQKIKDKALSKSIEFVIMDEKENHIIGFMDK